MPDAWDSYLDGALELPVAERNERLATLCLAAHQFTVLQSDASLGIPVARPSADLVRYAGAKLVEESISDLELTVGLVFRHWRRERKDTQDGERTDDLARAFLLAASSPDRLAETWVLMTRASHFIETQRPQLALESAEAARRALELATIETTGPYAAASPIWDESRDPGRARVNIGYYAWSVLRKARRYNGDLEGWIQGIERSVEIAAAAIEYRPSLYAAALGASFVMQRDLGGQADLSPFEELRGRSRGIDGTYLSHVAANAAARGDRAGAIVVERARVDLILGRLYPDLVGAGPGLIGEHLASVSEPDRRVLNSVANAAYEIALNLGESGRAMTSLDDRTLAIEWADLAAIIWAGWASNGLRAVRARRAVLAIQDNPDAVLDLIEVAQEAPRPGLRVNTIGRAAVLATAHRPAVLKQLDTMLEETWSAGQRARLLSSRAWLTQPGSDEYRAQCSEDAAAALELMSGRSSSSIPHVARAASVVAAVAHAINDWDQERIAIREALLAVGRMLLNATTTEQRLYLARLWSRAIRDALRFAEEHGDAELADLTAEIVRRDGVGVLLAAVVLDPLAPAEAIKISGDAITADTRDGDGLLDNNKAEAPVDEEEGGVNDDLARSAGDEFIAHKNLAAYEEAERLLGPLGSLIDPGSLFSARASDILLELPRTRPTFVLQLLPSTLPMVSGPGAPVLHRRLTWMGEDGPREILDAVALPAKLLEEPRSNDISAWQDSEPLFPSVLLDALAEASPSAPLRLLIIPSGLYHVQFDSLLVGDRELLQLALTSVHTSLTAMRHAITTLADRVTVGSFAILDSVKLPATDTERAALQRFFPEMFAPADKAELRELAVQDRAISIFAMGLHGNDDVEGWGQKKLLPNGEILTAAEALGYFYPELCVLASCHSRVRLAGVDHAGFPTALFARGAKTIVGSIGKIFDVSTSEILSLFYEDLQRTQDPVESLRNARLAWINIDAETRWNHHEKWARLVVYGGAHY